MLYNVVYIILQVSVTCGETSLAACYCQELGAVLQVSGEILNPRLDNNPPDVIMMADMILLIKPSHFYKLLK